jgi:hypothetical protein
VAVGTGLVLCEVADGWRYMVLLEGVAPVLVLCMIPVLPDSPVYLVLTEQKPKAVAALMKLRKS